MPEADLEPIARLAAPFRRVTVECHPRLVDERVRRFAELLPGRLEVAMGLETAHPEALARLGKQLTLEQFDRAARRLRADGVDLRVFVLVGVPFVPAEEQAEWAVTSVRHAARAGARTVALIPVRGGNGELERLQRLGRFEPPDLALLEECLAGAAEVAAARSPEHEPDDPRNGARTSPAGQVDPEDRRYGARPCLAVQADLEDRRRGPRPSLAVQLDPWDLDRVASACESCREQRVAAIREMNRTGVPRRTVCDDCGG